jgi:hypothetical protein
MYKKPEMLPGNTAPKDGTTVLLLFLNAHICIGKYADGLWQASLAFVTPRNEYGAVPGTEQKVSFDPAFWAKPPQGDAKIQG